MENYIWLFAIAGGAAMLGLALAFAVSRQKKLSSDDKRLQDQQVNRLYHK